jgi:hypothetical protein
MTTQIKTYKSNNSGLMIAVVISALVAAALAFYLTTTGHRQHAQEAAAEAPAAVSTLADAGQPAQATAP